MSRQASEFQYKAMSLMYRGKSFLNGLAEDNKLAVRSLAKLEALLRSRGIAPKIITGHTGWTDDIDFAFAHTDEVCHSLFRQKPHDPSAPTMPMWRTMTPKRRLERGCSDPCAA